MNVRSLTSGLAFEDDQLDPLLSFGLPTRRSSETPFARSCLVTKACSAFTPSACGTRRASRSPECH